jgi:hypothetical protein
MKAAGLLARMDDLLNPIVVKELRQAVKSRIVMAALLIFLVLQLGILLVVLLQSEYRNVNASSLNEGLRTFQVLQGLLLGTCMVLIPAYAGVRLAAERSDTNVDLLFISTLRPRAIIAGKFLAAVALILLIFSACAPFMTFTYLLRGIDIPSILLVLGLDFLAVLLGTQLAIFLGAVPANWGLKILLGLAGLGSLGMLFGMAMSGSIGLLETGMGGRVDTVEFWLLAGAIVTAAAAVIGLLFTWSIALVSSPSANRALPPRAFLVAAWLVTAGVAALLARRFQTPVPLYIWMDAFAALLCVQLLTSINEREQWGVRVTRTIPRRWWLRGPAFLLYSGAAGGVLFAAILLALTLSLPNLAVWYWDSSFAPIGRFVESNLGWRNTLVTLLVVLYIFNYSMTAVLLRNVLLRDRIKPAFTWVLALLLWGLGLSLPYLFLFLFNNEALRNDNINPWSHITNPFATIFIFVRDWPDRAGDGFPRGCLFFMSLWAALAAVLSLPWVVRQLARFRPPDQDKRSASAGGLSQAG